MVKQTRRRRSKRFKEQTDWLPKPDLLEAEFVIKILNGEAGGLDDDSRKDVRELVNRLAHEWPPGGALFHVLSTAITNISLALGRDGIIALATPDQRYLTTLAVVRVMADPDLRIRIRKCRSDRCDRYVLYRRGKIYCSSGCRNLVGQYRYRELHPERYRARQREVMQRARQGGKAYAF